MPLLAWRWRRPYNKECKQSVEADRDLLLTASKETGTSVLQPQGIELCQQLE